MQQRGTLPRLSERRVQAGINLTVPAIFNPMLTGPGIRRLPEFTTAYNLLHLSAERCIDTANALVANREREPRAMR
jgi:hypothetical protein